MDDMTAVYFMVNTRPFIVLLLFVLILAGLLMIINFIYFKFWKLHKIVVFLLIFIYMKEKFLWFLYKNTFFPANAKKSEKIFLNSSLKVSKE
jgi:hypothetical protein